jgi:hypothetical protein
MVSTCGDYIDDRGREVELDEVTVTPARAYPG